MWRLKAALYINYFVFAILLNSVGIVILKAQKLYGVDEIEASLLELFKDLPIAVFSFLVASFLPRLGYIRAMQIAMVIVGVACVGMYFGNSFGSAKLLFLAVGVAFALIKVSVYASIGQLTSGQREHNSLMSSIEGVFMFGITFGYFLFPWFNNTAQPAAWVSVYLVLAVLCLLSFIFMAGAKFENPIEIPGADLKDDFMQMIRLMFKLLVVVFVFSAFLFVMVEQGIMTWLPTFNERVLDLPENLAIILTSVLFISLGLGRLLAGFLVRFISWHYIVCFCLLCAMAMVYFVLPKAIAAEAIEVTRFSEIPFYGYVFPLVGLFLAPIYPLINSVVLSALPDRLHSPMSGLIIIFSAIGGTLGSRAIGYLFKNAGPEVAFVYTLIPMALLFFAVIALNKMTAKHAH